MMNGKVKNIIVRAAKTFIQAAMAYICTLTLTGIDWSNKSVVTGIMIAAIAAGISALMNVDWESITDGVNKDDLIQ